mmetsp:Transcript_86529/g.270734  ORF Transcript_86529/g.270734 Transcript_86529/m.270734 type:complete len:207 (-) Transcript_86529:859-1479(-)
MNAGSNMHAGLELLTTQDVALLDHAITQVVLERCNLGAEVVAASPSSSLPSDLSSWTSWYLLRFPVTVAKSTAATPPAESFGLKTASGLRRNSSWNSESSTAARILACSVVARGLSVVLACNSMSRNLVNISWVFQRWRSLLSSCLRLFRISLHRARPPACTTGGMRTAAPACSLTWLRMSRIRRTVSICERTSRCGICRRACMRS